MAAATGYKGPQQKQRDYLGGYFNEAGKKNNVAWTRCRSEKYRMKKKSEGE